MKREREFFPPSSCFFGFFFWVLPFSPKQKKKLRNRFAPPEKYVMSRLTPEAPPPFLAAILSPVLWRLERPDRFDSYAAGVSLLQLSFPGLRSDDAVVAFQKRLAECGGDLDRWAEEVGARGSRDYAEGFEFLDGERPPFFLLFFPPVAVGVEGGGRKKKTREGREKTHPLSLPPLAPSPSLPSLSPSSKLLQRITAPAGSSCAA